MSPHHDIEADAERHFRAKQDRECPLPGITVQERKTPKHALGQLILAHLPVEWQPGFTGRIIVEVDCKDGVVKDTYIVPRKKMVES